MSYEERLYRHCYGFGKGGATPQMPAPAAPPPPPPAATAQEVQLQRRETLKSAAKRRGIRSTILAGDDEAGKGGATLLGG